MTTQLTIAVAQTGSVKGDITANTATHLHAIEKAAEAGVSYLVFPELSLTGYEPDMAVELAFLPGDSRLKPLIDAACRHTIRVAAGAPLQTRDLPHIGEIIIYPDGRIETYAKMNLHPGEERWFSAGNSLHWLTLDQEKIFNAVCADTAHARHVRECSQQGASVYLAGVLISENGYQADTDQLAGYAKKYNILTAMANHNRPTGGWRPAGKSAVWYGPHLLARADQTRDALVVARKTPAGWDAEVIHI